MIFLLAALTAPAHADCATNPLVPTGSLPADGQTNVPLDARLVVRLGGGFGDAGQFDVALKDASGAVPPFGTASWGGSIDGPQTTEYWVKIVPNAPLLPTTSYTILVDSNDRYTGDTPVHAEFHFQTGTEPGHKVAGQPAVEITSIGAPHRGGKCDWDLTSDLSLHVTPAQPDPSGLSLLHVYEGDGTLIPDIPVRSFPLPASTGPEGIDLSFPFDPIELHPCFLVTQEDAHGTKVTSDGWVCTDLPPLDTGDTGPVDTDTDTDTDTTPPGHASGGHGLGCATVSGTFLASLLPMLASLLARRRVGAAKP